MRFTIALVPVLFLGACPAAAPTSAADPQPADCIDGVCPAFDSRRPLPGESSLAGCPAGSPGVAAPGRTVEGLGPCDPPAAHLGPLR